MSSKTDKELTRFATHSSRDQNVPFRRISSRLQARAEEKAEQIEIEKRDRFENKQVRERSRSRSASRPLKIAKGSKSTETAKLEFINEELPEITSSNKKSPGKRGRTDRFMTPTRSTLTQETNSRSHKALSFIATPVKLTRSARKLGFSTPDQLEPTKLVVAESPQTSLSVDISPIVADAEPHESPLTKTKRVQKEESSEKADVAPRIPNWKKSNRNSIGAFLRNWKGNEYLREENEEEDMDVSRAEFAALDSEERSSPDTDQAEEKTYEHKKAGLTEQVLLLQNQEAESMVEILDKQEQIEDAMEEPIVETIKLCIERTLEVEYIQKEDAQTNEDSITMDNPVREKLVEKPSPNKNVLKEISAREEDGKEKTIADKMDESTYEGQLITKEDSIKYSRSLEKVHSDVVKARSPDLDRDEVEEAALMKDGIFLQGKDISQEEKPEIFGNMSHPSQEHFESMVEVEKKKRIKKTAIVKTKSPVDVEKLKPDKKKKRLVTETDIAKQRERNGALQEKKKEKKILDHRVTKKISVEAKQMVSDDGVEDGFRQTSDSNKDIAYPEISMEKMFSESRICSDEMSVLLQALYSWSNRLQRRDDDLPDVFLNNHTETIWQFIAHKNRQINASWRKTKNLLDESIGVLGIEEENIEDNEFLDEELPEDDTGDEQDDENCDIFNLNDEDLKDLERELDEERSSFAGTSSDKENEKPRRKKYPKSVVDDKFFNLAEMDAFCDEAEKQNDEEELLATVDDSWGGAANYRYEDFFGKLDDVISEDEDKKRPKKRKTAISTEQITKKEKRVRFALDEEDEEEETPEEESVDPKPILLGKKCDEEIGESKLKADIRKLKESIHKLEEENLQPRSWELSGEVTAQQRSENELLEAHLQFDNSKKRAPEITEDFTEKLEAMIKQRIKDQAFDDVVRVKKIDEKVDVFRNEAIEEQEIMKKSLSEVYEKEYQKAAGQSVTTEKENPLHKAIEEKMNNLFLMIDAMSHFEYTPPPVRPEIKVVSNMAALTVEEVGMHASTDAQLLAPEEMRKKQKSDLKGEEERSKTDKLRQRRKKKSKQRAMVQKIGAEKALSGQMEKKLKKKKRDNSDKKEENLKSSNFFNRLQDTVQKEIREKTTKKKMKSEKVTSSGSKFKL